MKFELLIKFRSFGGCLKDSMICESLNAFAILSSFVFFMSCFVTSMTIEFEKFDVYVDISGMMWVFFLGGAGP